MLEKLMLNLQLFADGGGDGGDGGSSSASAGEAKGSNNSGETEIPAFIPEKAKKIYQKAMERQSGSTTEGKKETSDEAHTTDDAKATEDIPYDELIKSDKYKDAHKAYMDKTIGDRLKKYKGIEEDNGKYRELLETVAMKYGVDVSSEDFLALMKEKIDEDDSYYENYAMEHDTSPAEARKIVTMQRKAERFDEMQRIEAETEQERQRIMVLRQNAVKTKAQFPEFDLDTEWQDERFRRLCWATNGDTTAAYKTCHHDEIISSTVQRASRQIQAQTAQAVASNKARPIENGLSSQAPSVVTQDFSKMNLSDIRKYAEEQRRKQAGR